MKLEKQYHSYLVRLWQDELDDLNREGVGTSHWQGEVIHIQSGKSWQIDNLEPLLELINELTTNNER